MTVSAADGRPFSVDIVIDGRCILLRLGGSLVRENVPRLVRWLERIGRLDGPVRVAVDLRSLAGCDADGAAALITGAQRIRQVGGRLIIASLPATCEATFADMTMLDVRRTVSAAIEELDGWSP